MKLPKVRLTIFSCLAGLLLASLFLTSSPVAAQETSTPGGAKKAAATTSTDKAKKSRGGGEDSNIKSKTPQNDPSKFNDPSPKATGKTRGSGPGYCRLHVDSRVNAYVNIFVDGDFRGTVGPGGDVYGYTGNGATTLYGRADFTDGSSFSWGPRVIDCEGAFNWAITP